jgi:hypothetical protein
VVANLGEAWPELVAQRSLIEQVVASEEDSFSRTLRQGSTLLEGPSAGPGSRAAAMLGRRHRLPAHDTYGFPYELTLEAAAEAGLDVDADRFRQLMDDQRRRAKEARRELDADLRRLESYRDLSARHGRTTFVGYETTTAEGRILGLLRDGEELAAAGEGDQVELILDRTPFYAEGGGQVGDTGLVRTGGGAVLQVTDTRPGLEGFYVHSARVVSGSPGRRPGPRRGRRRPPRGRDPQPHRHPHPPLGAARPAGRARPPAGLAGRRRPAALRLRPLPGRPGRALAEIEAAVNRQLLADPDVRVWHGTLAEAEAAGALSLFGEKYGSVVRVVEVGDFSRELCGGTHVGHGSQVGPVHVLGEASIGANLRRIEALTGLEALHYVDRERQLLAEVAALLKTRPEDAPEQLRRRLEALATATRELERLRVAGLERLAAGLAGRVARRPAAGWWPSGSPTPGPTTCAGSPARSATGSGPGPGWSCSAPRSRARRPWSPCSPPTWPPRARRPGTCWPGRPRRSGARRRQGRPGLGRRPRPEPAGRGARHRQGRRAGTAPGGDGGSGASRRGPRRTGARGMTGRVLALDVGSRRLGVAVSDPTGTVASPLATVPRRTPAEDAAALAALAAEHDATTVVAGLPVTLAGARARRPGPSAPTWTSCARCCPGWPSSWSTSGCPPWPPSGPWSAAGSAAATGARSSTRSRPASSSRPGWTAGPGGRTVVSRAERRLRMRRRRRGVLVMGLLLLLAGAGVFQALQWSAAREKKAPPPGQPVTITVASGQSSVEIGRALRDAGVVDSVNRFRDVAEERGLDSLLKPGTYKLETGMSIDAVLDILAKGPRTGIPLTIPEGFTVAQIVEKLAATDQFTKAEVTKALTSKDLIVPLRPKGVTSLEGLLFPDTYGIERTTPPSASSRTWPSSSRWCCRATSCRPPPRASTPTSC